MFASKPPAPPSMENEANPYAPPVADVDGGGDDMSRAEETRKEFLKHEAAVRSVGVLYYIAAIIWILGTIGFALSGEGSDGMTAVSVIIVFFGFGVGAAAVGRGLRRLRRWVKIPVGILSGLGLLGFPIGTLINGYILYLVFGKKGTMVFSDDYHEIIDKTPHIRYRTSVLVWIFLGLILLLIVAAVVIPAFSGAVP